MFHPHLGLGALDESLLLSYLVMTAASQAHLAGRDAVTVSSLVTLKCVKVKGVL